MSVATEGVKGYEYQYKVTVLFALLHCNDFKSKLYVEKIGSEDITFVDENRNSIEIQIKRERNNIGFSKIIEWLSHFQERSSSNNLLLRVKEKKTKCLFVTRSRCNDEALMFLKEFPVIDSNSNSISVQDILKFKNELKGIKFKDTKLDIKRKAFCEEISNKLNKSDIEVLVNNTLIWEKIGEEKVDNEILNCLNKKFSIPQSLSENLYLKLLEIVKKGRDSKEDIIPTLKNLIFKSKVNRYAVTENYISRKEEVQSLEILNNSNLLLLTGISQCGKTELAKKIANDFIDIGYNSVSVSSEFFQIENFFNQNREEDKILIFEDPFGHIKPKSESNDIKNKIIDLSKKLALNHKLIITSKIEILDEAFSEKIHENIINLTEDDNKLILNFWVKFSEAQKVNKLIVEKVSEYIREETEHKIQVGQLNYLSRYDSDKLNSRSLTELISIARHNANDISNNLLKDNLEQSKILGIMSICCNNSIGVNIEDLGFILSDDDNQYSIFKKTKFYEVLNYETKFPKYAKTNKIKKRFKESIAYFEERGFLKYDSNKYFFSHPNYYEVGKNLFFRKSFEEQKLNIEYLKKSIICINPTSSLFSCKQLVLVYNRINLNFRQNIRELMFLSNRSIFPAVEDFSSINLISIIDDIDNDKEKEKIINIINRGNTDSSSIRWYNKEIPFLCKRDDAEHYFGHKISEKEIEEIESKILNNVDVKLYDVWRFVNYYKLVAQGRIYNKFNANLINSLLYHEEVFIRKHVAKLFFLSKINKDEIFLIEKIFNDNHPTVVFYGIWGSFLNWNIHSSEIKDFIFNILKELFSKQEIAIRANNLITNFSIDYSGESINWREFSKRDVTELWNIWAEIFPIFFKNLPVNIFLNDGRYYDTMVTSMKYLTFNNGIKVFETWLDRIELRIQNKIEITDYEMAISDELLEFTGNNFEIRKELFKRILSNNNSIFCLYNLKLTIKYWNKLNTDEKNIILNLIDSNRKDLRWIRATVLVQYEIPKEIEVKIVGDINLYSLKPVKVLEILPAQLINDCLKIIYSQPYELEYLRPSSLSDFWKKIINYILFYQVEPFFDICVKEFIRYNIFGTRSDNFLLWQKICLNSKNLNYLTYLVIYNISRGSIYINGTKKIINGLIYSYKERDEYEVFIKIIANEIETLQQTSQKLDIIKILGKDLILKDLYRCLFPDIVMKMLIEKRQIDLLETLTEENKSFRFFLSYIAIENVVDENKELKNEIKSRLLSIPNEIDHVGETKKKELKEKYFKEVKIEDWIG